jgi:hypothetical protein
VGARPTASPKWDGNSWSALGSGISNRVVYALAVSGGDLYAAGDFRHAGGRAANFIAKWDGTTWTTLGSGMNNDVLALAVSENNLYAGGSFAIAGGKISAYVARAVLGDAPGYNQLTGKILTGNTMQFSYTGYPATNYALDRAFNLAPPVDWVAQKTNTMTISGVLSFTDTLVPTTNNFWRIRPVP